MSFDKPIHITFRRPPLKDRPSQSQVTRLNDRLKRLENILPRHPYLISVPSDVPYHHSARFVNKWHEGTPFTREEEQLQYISFLSYQGDVSLLKAVGGWSDDQGKAESEVSPQTHEATSTRPNTPSSLARKKITLSDYRNKAKSSVDMLEKQASVHGPEKDSFPEKDLTMKRGINEPGPPEAKDSKKRLHDQAMVLCRQEDKPIVPSRVEKKPRISSPIRIAVNQEGGIAVNQDDGKAASTPTQVTKEVPPIVSPTLLIPLKPLTSPEPPEMQELLSPTLPSPIEAFLLKEPEKVQTNGVVPHQRTDSVKSLLAIAGFGSSPNPGIVRSPSFQTGNAESRGRSDSRTLEKSAQSTTLAAEPKTNARVSSPVAKFVKDPIKPSTPHIRTTAHISSPGPRQRHTIILKYGKRNRKRVEALLKFAPRGKKLQLKSGTSNGGGSLGDTHPRPPKPEIRHTSPASSEPAAKPQRPPPSPLDLSEKTRTPTAVVPKSPPTRPAIKPIFSTPKKDLKSTAMRRVESSEGLGARTPTSGPTRQSTPLSVERSSTAVRSSSPPTSAPVGHTSRDEERRAWHKLHTKYFELGRTIKKEGTSFGLSPSDAPNSKDAALSVVLLIEALSCFMVNLAALSYSGHHTSSDPGWRTIIPLHIFVFRASRKYPHLHGLVVQLGAVCRQAIHRFDMDRLARDPLPDEHGSVPTPGSDGTTKTSEDVERYRKKYLSFRDDLVGNATELQTAWLDRSRLLSLDTLKKDYPETWEKRARDTSLRGHERISPTHLGGDFFLPQDATTSPFEAVRFAVAFLQEWVQKEGVPWKPRIEL